MTLDGRRLELEPGQTVVSHGVDRNLSIDEAERQEAVVGRSDEFRGTPRFQ